MEAVWTESPAQAQDMLGVFTKTPSNGNGDQAGETAGTFGGMKSITINVITTIGFGTHRSWTASSNDKSPPSYQMRFMRSMLTIVHNLCLAIFVLAHILNLHGMPETARNVNVAVTEFPLHLRDIISKERRSPTTQNTLVSSLVKIADQDPTPPARQSKASSTYLSEEEITGNLFNVAIAGFDTTANTLVYAVMLLALHPEWQDWIIAHIDDVKKRHSQGGYAACFPQLTRVLAVMVREGPLPRARRRRAPADPRSSSRRSACARRCPTSRASRTRRRTLAPPTCRRELSSSSARPSSTHRPSTGAPTRWPSGPRAG